MPLFRPAPPPSAASSEVTADPKPLTADELLSPEDIADRRRRRRRFVLLPLLFAALVGAGFGARPALHVAKAWQARRAAREAERLIGEQRWVEARGKVQDALQIWQTEPMALRATAMLLSRTGNIREAVSFWKRLEEFRPLTGDEEREYAQTLLATRNLASTESHLRKAWPAGQEGTPKDWELGMQLALGRRQSKEAIDLAHRLLVSPAATPRQRLTSAIVLASSSEKPAQTEGWNVILDLSNGPATPESLEALLILAQRANPALANLAAALPTPAGWPPLPELINRIEAHPLAKIQHRLLMFDLRIAQNPTRRAEELQTAIDRFAKSKDDADLGMLVGWLYGKSEYNRVLEVLPAERAATDSALFLHRLDALAALDRWADIRREMQGQRGLIDPMLEQMYLARCAAQLHEPRVEQARWEAALDAAGNKPEKLIQLGTYAQKNGNFEISAKAFGAAIQAAPELREAYEGQLQLNEARGDTSKVRATLALIAQRWPQDTAVRNDAAYFDALLGENLQAALATARELVRADPSSLPHRITLALAELRSGNDLSALDVFAAVDLAHAAMQPRQRAVLAAVFWATSFPREARATLRNISLDRLLPEERALVQPILETKGTD